MSSPSSPISNSAIQSTATSLKQMAPAAPGASPSSTQTAALEQGFEEYAAENQQSYTPASFQSYLSQVQSAMGGSNQTLPSGVEQQAESDLSSLSQGGSVAGSSNVTLPAGSQVQFADGSSYTVPPGDSQKVNLPSSAKVTTPDKSKTMTSAQWEEQQMYSQSSPENYSGIDNPANPANAKNLGGSDNSSASSGTSPAPTTSPSTSSVQ